MLLARGKKSEFRFYNVSSLINKDKNHYYDILERMQHGDGDITENNMSSKMDLFINEANDYARDIGAPVLHPHVSVIHYDEVGEIRHSLNRIDCHGISLEMSDEPYLILPLPNNHKFLSNILILLGVCE